MRVIAEFDLPDGSKPLERAELAFMDPRNHLQWEKTHIIRVIPKPLKVKLTRRKD